MEGSTMQTIRPIKLSSHQTNTTEKLTSAELGKLWATYMGNSMSKDYQLFSPTG
jgi:hypothetical protein